MITYRQAKKLLHFGETVYSLGENREIVEAKILDICKGFLRTDFGTLEFEDHGTTWWLTENGARDSLSKTVPEGWERYEYCN